jgi:hypothetical protein
MVRRKAAARIQPIIRTTSTRRNAWDEEFLGQNRYNPRGSIGPVPGVNSPRSVLDINQVRSQAGKLVDQTLASEIIMAINGDDEALLPYQPTPTIDPGRPRTLAAGYDERSQALRIKFRNGEYYTYYNVPPSVWWQFQRAQSPGRFINSRLNSFPYSRGIT